MREGTYKQMMRTIENKINSFDGIVRWECQRIVTLIFIVCSWYRLWVEL